MMAGTAFLNKEFILNAVRMGLENAVEEAADRVAADAKRRAPIRKVFREAKGYRRRTRALTDAEKALAIKRAVEYYGSRGNDFALRRSVAHTTFYARVRKPDQKSANNLSKSRKMRDIGVMQRGRFTASAQAAGTFRNRRGGFEPGDELKAKLTSRGRYEVRNGRAIHMETSRAGTLAHVQIGGALKASIAPTPVHETANGVEAEVEAAIRYAKFVEFPTIRTQAQPFLLPALAQERIRFPRAVANAIKKNLGG